MRLIPSVGISKMFNEPSEIKIAIIGLGYVGLPLAVEFSKKFNVVGFDTSSQRIRSIRDGIDNTLELSADELQTASKSRIHLTFRT